MKLKTMLTAASAAVFLSACSGESDHSAAHTTVAEHAEHEMHASYEYPATNGVYVAMLHGTEGNENVHGFVMFTQDEDGVFVAAHAEGLPANSVHGFHVHEFGDCSAPDATSAGGHFNPHGRDHGGPDSEARHVGDLGNLHSDENGIAHLEMLDHKLELSGPNSIIGKAVVVHVQEDDLTSQPVGNAGARIACGVIVADDEVEHQR